MAELLHAAAPHAASFPMNCVIADFECHLLSAWADSTRSAFQAASGLSIQRRNRTTEARREAMLSQREAQT
jgi:hypothetical protein